jgi:ribosomal protein L10
MGGIKYNGAKIISAKKSEKRLKKEDYWRKLWSLTDEYHKAILVDIDNVSSQQLSQIRIKLRSLNAKMIMGKNVYLFKFIH